MSLKNNNVDQKSINDNPSLHEKFDQIHDKWKQICQTKNTKKIIHFWNDGNNKKILSIKGAWYLKTCILYNDIQSVSYLLDDPLSISYIDSKFGYGNHATYTPILYASRYSDFNIIQLLCQKGCDVSLSINSNLLEYIFENSTLNGDIIIECVQYLVTFGCNVVSNAIWCLSYYNSDREFDRVYLAEYLRNNGASMIHVTTAIKYGHFALASWLIENKCKIYDTYLTDVKSAEGINLLIKNGIRNINHNDNVYGTALYYHSQRGNICAVAALLNNNANRDVLCTNMQLTALQIATKNKHNKIVKLLRNYNDNNNDADNLLNNKKSLINMSSSSKYNINFSKIPLNPSSLSDDISSEEKYFDECNATAMLIENKIETLQAKIRKEYSKILSLRKEQNIRNERILLWKYSLNYWSDFLSCWEQWDINCFIEWLKRIKYSQHSFHKYFKSHQDAVNSITKIILSDPLTFGSCFKNDDDVTFGKQLRAFDRYTLFKIGITETEDCNVILTEIHKLFKRNLTDHDINDDDFNNSNENICTICWSKTKTHVLNCGHRFDLKCIQKIQNESNSCPLCNVKISIVIKLY